MNQSILVHICIYTYVCILRIYIHIYICMCIYNEDTMAKDMIRRSTSHKLHAPCPEEPEYSPLSLLEVHDEAELERALNLRSPMIGINNRNLHTFETHLETTLDLLSEIPGDQLVVTESGINCVEDVSRMRIGGVHAFLVGEALLRAPDPGEKLATLFGSA